MNRRPDAETNGKPQMNGNGKNGKGKLPYPYTEFERRRFSKSPIRWISSLFPIAVFCLAVGVAIAVTMRDSKRPSPGVATVQAEAFRWAVNRAMSAAELTQIAASEEEWNTIATWWQEASDFMKAVPDSHPKYEIAQSRVSEYQSNREYAQTKANASTIVTDPSTNLWSVGSRKTDVLRIQGPPSREPSRYDALCQEVLHFENSTVELSNGIVTKYDDSDRNLKVAPEDVPTTSPSGSPYVWTLGSTREEVFRVQGTPDRISSYESLNRETLYYGNSTIELTDDRVTGYSNLGNSLRVSVEAAASGATSPFWTIGSQREDVFRIQGTPEQISLDDSLCREVLRYGNSSVELKNGLVTGYDNLGNNLRVRVE
ncbi:MAG: hypothetical protein HC769_06540 [Cyanobacteria bacterium CRU_2_1]|nr:hypothetical protein [Cyanobacteria bacterium RU_5_0]NJR58538.1 hypothetical protein [Cyanobacteria bacterium CRU_2_1]